MNPFNPFARDASAQRNKRMGERSQAQRRQNPPSRDTARPASQPVKPSGMSELAKKRQDALNRLGDTPVPKTKPVPVPANESPAQQPSPTITNSVEVQPSAPAQSRENRLAELRRKSEESRKNAKVQRKDAVVEPEVEAKIVMVAPLPVETKASPLIEEAVVSDTVSDVSTRSDVFKQIQTEVTKTSANDRKRKRRRADKKGGGRQKQEKKLNRQKYLEYKYAAKDILLDDEVSEEHRSNILGQVWAKGERIGVAASIEFLEQKVEEEILPSSVAGKLKDLVSRMTTRR
tara:strand:+ start:4749 stop:5615 length:867 start_codon:yes stop_codon:yes gene_type:complete